MLKSIFIFWTLTPNVDCSSSHTVPCCGPSFRPLPSLTCTSPSYSETDRLYLEYNVIWQCVNNISALCCSKLYYFCLPTYFLNKTTIYLLFSYLETRFFKTSFWFMEVLKVLIISIAAVIFPNLWWILSTLIFEWQLTHLRKTAKKNLIRILDVISEIISLFAKYAPGQNHLT